MYRYEVLFQEGGMGFWLYGDKVQELVKGGQAEQLGVIPGSVVVKVGGKPLINEWVVPEMLQSEKRPVLMTFRKPAISDLVESESTAELRELEYVPNYILLKSKTCNLTPLNDRYEVIFDEGALGTEIDSKLIIRGVTKGSQADFNGVQMGSTILVVGSR
jgi:S1-C subfamily serine protease